MYCLQDAWAICKIFKKANSSVQRSLSHSWISPSPIALADLPDKLSVNKQTISENTLTLNTASSVVVPRTFDESKYGLHVDLPSSYRTLYPTQMTHSQNPNSSLLCSFNISSSSLVGDTVKSPSCPSLVDHVYSSCVGKNAGEISGLVKSNCVGGEISGLGKSNCGGQWEPTGPNLGFSFISSSLPNMHSWELASSCSSEYPASYI